MFLVNSYGKRWRNVVGIENLEALFKFDGRHRFCWERTDAAVVGLGICSRFKFWDKVPVGLGEGGIGLPAEPARFIFCQIYGVKRLGDGVFLEAEPMIEFDCHGVFFNCEGDFGDGEWKGRESLVLVSWVLGSELLWKRK